MLGWVLGISTLLLWSRLPSLWICVLLVMLAIGLIGVGRRWGADLSRFRAGAWCLFGLAAGMAWSIPQAQQVLEHALPRACEGQRLDAIIRVADLSQPGFPEGERFLAETLQPHRCWPVGARWQLSTAEIWPAIPGEVYQVGVKLKRVHGLVNPAGFDAEKYWHHQRVTAFGRVGSAQRLQAAPVSIDRWRWQFRQHWLAAYGEHAEAGTLLALMTGDRYAITPEAWERYARTGVTHLMAISGMHITMLGLWVAWLVRALWLRQEWLALRLPALWPASVAGLLAAIAYASIAGMELPAQRTVLMLAIVVLARCLPWRCSSGWVWLLALTVVLLLDPLAVHSVGLWLSFVAVGLLLLLTQMTTSAPVWRQVLKTQWWVSVGLLPITVAIFERVSWLGLPVNWLAIPWLSWLVVPLSLVSLCLHTLWPTTADALWRLALQLLSIMEQALVWVAQWQWGWSGWVLSGTALLAMGALAFGLLAVSSWRWRTLLWLPLLVLIWPQDRPQPGQWWLTVLDVGQGLAVHVQTHRHQLLFDTGASFMPHAGSGHRVILPFLHERQAGPLDALVLSHDDLDHTGGAAAVLAHWPVKTLLGVKPQALQATIDKLPLAVRDCRAGERWQWDGVEFSWLWPEPSWQFRHDNERSCVLKISGLGHSVLITGDVGLKSESAMISARADDLRADVLLLGHHGSKTSTSVDWLATVQPKIAVATVGYRNRFHHPHASVLARLQQQGIPLYRSDESGALVWRFVDERWPTVEQQRVEAPHYWRASERNSLP